MWWGRGKVTRMSRNIIYFGNFETEKSLRIGKFLSLSTDRRAYVRTDGNHSKKISLSALQTVRLKKLV